jgi:hypothetical protein
MSSLSVELTTPSLEQAVRNHKKVARAAIRLQKSIEADTILDNLMPIITARLAAQAQQGLIPAISVAELMDMADEA